MSEAKRELVGQDGQQSKNGPDCYVSPFDVQAANPAAAALQSLFPLGTPRARLVAFFGHRAAAYTVMDWRRGRRKPPQWALDTIRDYARQLDTCASSTRANDPATIGTEALRRYRLERRARSLQR